MNSRIVFVLLLFSMFFSCADLSDENEFGDDFILKAGTVCGWCTVNDTLEIKGVEVRYVNYEQCNNAVAAVDKKGKLLKSEIENLLDKFDEKEFKSIELNTCNVCVDGCDNWIYFENSKGSHYIRFGGSDKKLEPIQMFIDQLFLIKESYSGTN